MGKNKWWNVSLFKKQHSDEAFTSGILTLHHLSPECLRWCALVLWPLPSATWTVPCTSVLHLPIDQATTAVFHNKQINNRCHSSLVMPSQHLYQVPPLLLWRKWSDSSDTIWDTNMSDDEFLSKMLRNRTNVLIKQDTICLCHSYPVPPCLRYEKEYFCLSLNMFICVWTCVLVSLLL